MTELQLEAFNAVKRINDEIYNKYKKLDKKNSYHNYLSKQPILTITFADDMFFINLSPVSEQHISLPEIPIYSSIHDDRIYYEKSDKHETFYKYIRRKFKLLKEEFYLIKI